MTPHSPLSPTTALPLLRAGAAALGIPLSQSQLLQFELYYRLLVEWNETFNLTAITDYPDVQVKHFLDSLAGWPVIAGEMGIAGTAPAKPLHLADIGTGAGFPGLPLKIAVPRIKLTLIDGTGKKVTFLKQVIETLGLANTTVVQGRAEELGQQPSYRGQFDLVAARAVAPLNTLAEYLLPLVRREGMAVIYKGAAAPQEFVEARTRDRGAGRRDGAYGPCAGALAGRTPLCAADPQGEADPGSLSPRPGAGAQAADRVTRGEV